jgi:hypothetical protein
MLDQNDRAHAISLVRAQLDTGDTKFQGFLNNVRCVVDALEELDELLAAALPCLTDAAGSILESDSCSRPWAKELAEARAIAKKICKPNPNKAKTPPAPPHYGIGEDVAGTDRFLRSCTLHGRRKG